MPKTDYKKILQYSFLIVAFVALCRLTRSYISLFFLAIALMNAWSKRPRLSVMFCLLLPFVNCISGYIVGDRTVLMYVVRIGLILVGICLYLSSQNANKSQMPSLDLLFLYCLFMTLPSINGYAPNVSFLKLAYFVGFIVSALAVAKCMTKDLFFAIEVRHFSLAICAVLVFGSLLSLRFPAIAFPLNSKWLMRAGMDLDTANEAMSQGMGFNGISLFAGITFHSQMLGPMLALVLVFLACDVLFVECRIDTFHTILIVLTIVFSYMTRSRTALGTIILSSLAIADTALSYRRVPYSMQRKIRTMVGMSIFLAVVAGCILEARSSTLSKWLAKGSDSHQITAESMTATRAGAWKKLIAEFCEKPLVGNGFQVNKESARFKDKGFILSAPIEKGNVFLLLLSEGGIVGSLIFASFMVVFYSHCRRSGLHCTMLLMTAFLILNLGEAIFFSPGSTGGFCWIFILAAGFALDLVKNQIELPYRLSFAR